ncbi:MAG: hypothetical protein AB2637_07710 [Candidatus Thiodiazotropha sp.]
MASFTAVFDACVLYPAHLRDLLMSVAMRDQFRAKWTVEIQKEWVNNLLENRPDLKVEQLQWTVEQMNKAVPDCLVENYEEIIDSLELFMSRGNDCIILNARQKHCWIYSINRDRL